MKSNLERKKIKYDERVLPRLNMTQLFYYDPDGIAVECNFPAAETAVPRSRMSLRGVERRSNPGEIASLRSQ